MTSHARMALGAVLFFGSALASAQSRPNPRRPHCPPLDPSVFGTPPPSPSPIPYGGGAALAVGALGIVSRVRKRSR